MHWKQNITKLPFFSIAIDALYAVRHPQWEWELLKDYIKTFRQTRFFREARMATDTGKTLLIASMSDWVYQIKIEAMLALGLRMKGWRIVVLTERTNRWAHRYFRAFGLDEFIYWEDQLKTIDPAQCEQEAQRFLSTDLTLSAVKQWTYQGAWIGPQMIASISRLLLQGTPDPNDPVVRTELRRLLPQTIATVHRAKTLLERVRPAMMIVIEANYAMMGPLVDCAIAQGVNVIQTVQPSRDDAMMLRRLTPSTRRQHPSSVSAETLERVKKLPWGESQESAVDQEFSDRYGGKWFLQSRNQPGVQEKSREEIIKELHLDPAKKIVVLFSHILWDANLFYGEDLFQDYGDWFIQTIQAAIANPLVNWIVKLHPANLWKRARENVQGEFSEITLINKKIGKLPLHIHLLYPNTDISTRSLFDLADYGITVRGTPGMELPCFGVITLTAGTGRYSDLGFTNDSSTKEEYLDTLERIHKISPMTEERVHLARQHAYAAFRLRPWPMKSFKSVFNYPKQGTHPLDHNLLPQVKSLEEITRNGDLQQWAHWAAEETAIDFVNLPSTP